jgi:hypothetical protein
MCCVPLVRFLKTCDLWIPKKQRAPGWSMAPDPGRHASYTVSCALRRAIVDPAHLATIQDSWCTCMYNVSRNTTVGLAGVRRDLLGPDVDEAVVGVVESQV